MVLNNMFKDVDILTKGLNASWKRNEVISNNIANVNTPNYKKMEVKFEELLKNQLNNKVLKGANTNERHIPIGNNRDLNYKVSTNKDYSTRRDGNNVDIDIEMADMAKNDIYYRTLSTQLNNKVQRIKLVISEGKR
ncbi:flagellar basal-body rod protein FlgB [Serpentinicella alkaliphila]|uniref:Flagellar basal body rod protein FlgB n=2 Tax=Serpentinicella alkaliphila TaxID=1734049 RepID=A0A4R2TQH4_9FIRM|nr:flagellar basal-body rod protein FlgB [Serpentinicella alkaliphila]